MKKKKQTIVRPKSNQELLWQSLTLYKESLLHVLQWSLLLGFVVIMIPRYLIQETFLANNIYCS